MLLLHATGFHARCWDATIKALPQDWHFIALDLRGHGRSYRPDSLSDWLATADDAAAFAQAELSKPVFAIGHSMGGYVAARTAVMAPDKISGMLLVDPSYELPADYGRVVACVRDAMTRFAQGVYLVWYPIVRRSVSAQLPGRLARIARGAPKGWLHASLSVAEPDEQGFGMTGSGVFVINPPHTLRPALEAALPWLRDALARTPRARFLLEHDQQARDEAGPRDGVASARRATLPKGRHVHARTPR